MRPYPFEIGAAVVIKEDSETEYFATYYPELVDEVFIVESYMVEDDSHGHVKLKCITDSSKKFPVYFHTYIFKSAL